MPDTPSTQSKRSLRDEAMALSLTVASLILMVVFNEFAAGVVCLLAASMYAPVFVRGRRG